MPLLERAAALAPDDPWVQTALGRALVALFEEPRAPDDASALLRGPGRCSRGRSSAIPTRRTRASCSDAPICCLAVISSAPRPSLERAVQLTPGREDYRLLLAQAFIRQGRPPGPRICSVHCWRVGAGRRSGNGPDSCWATWPSGSPQPTPPERGTRDPTRARRPGRRLPARRPAASRGPRFQPDLRRVGPGETRVHGIFRSVDCRKDAVVLNIDQDGRVLAFRRRNSTNVEFISYRQNAPTGVQCGAQPQACPCSRPSGPPTPSAGVDGYVVAIEMVEDGYVPR